MHLSIVNDMAVCIMVAWMLAVVSHLFRQPIILAYLAAGIIVGPSGFHLVEEKASIETISELGLILLLFMIGLEIDLKKIIGAGRAILFTGAVQIIGCFLLSLGLFHITGFELTARDLDALYLAVAVALSSTVIVVKILYDKRELDTVVGRITLGVLVLQDLFAIIFLAFQPNLSHPDATVLLRSLGSAAMLVVVAFTSSRYVMPPLFRAVARLPELVQVGALAWCFLIAGLASALDLSREMGALVAGVAISTFPFTLDVVAKVTGLRDFFVTLFFVALGMSIPAPTAPLLKWSAVLVAIVVASRFLTVFPLLYRLKQGIRASLLSSIYLAQVSEFSLVILALGQQSGHIQPETHGVASYAFACLAVLSTYAMVKSDGIIKPLGTWLVRAGLKDLDRQATPSDAPKKQPRFFLLGFSWTASSFLEELTRRNPILVEDLAVIDFNPNANRELRARGVNVIYGDISHRETLLHAGVGEAQVILCTLPNTVLKGTNNLRLVKGLREINATAQIIAHAELFEDVPKLYAAGASYVCVPRVIEAEHLCVILEAALDNLLDEKRAELARELENRKEVIP